MKLKLNLKLSKHQFQTLTYIVLIFAESIQGNTITLLIIQTNLLKLYNRLCNREINMRNSKSTIKISLNIFDIHALSFVLHQINVNNYASYEQNFILFLQSEIHRFGANLMGINENHKLIINSI